MDRDPRIWVGLDRLVALEAQARGFDFLPRQPVGSALSGRRASRLRDGREQANEDAHDDREIEDEE